MQQSNLHDRLPQVKALLRRHGVQRASLFGSAARGEMQAGSDVDLLIAFAPETDYITYGTQYFALLYALQQLLETEVDLVAEETLQNPYLIESINRDKIVLL